MRIILPRVAILIGTRPDRNEQLTNCLKSIKTVYPVIASEVDGYEIGKFKELLSKTKIERFVFLQDSVEIKDNSIFDLCFACSCAVSLCDYPQQFGCYLGMYDRNVLEKMDLPDIKTKLDSVNYEEKIANEYSKHGSIWNAGEDLKSGKIINKWGHKVMKLENKYLIKYKSVWNRSML